MKSFVHEMKKQGIPIKPGERIDYVIVETDKTGKGVKMRAVDYYNPDEEKIDLVVILRDGVPIYKNTPSNTECKFMFVDDQVEAGQHFYFLRAKLEGDPSLTIEGDPKTNPLDGHRFDSRYPHNLARARGPFAWTSPVWVTVNL